MEIMIHSQHQNNEVKECSEDYTDQKRTYL